MTLSVKTRGGTDPQGKPRVYFCCHPDDYPLYFNRITDSILKKSNCAIYYPADPAAGFDVDAFAEDIRHMNLVIVVVTSRFLAENNRAYSVEFRFAQQFGIPILPLLQETGLGELFAEKCGQLQYLDINNVDPTAISFDEKLTKFLNAVLLSDETATQIRASFRAYIFLSYRKKDRKYALALMKKIHSIAFCKDIAIWYDEFLVPGENFNDSIAEALRKSRLFVLAVTPNLVNEKNYVMDVEYPMAVKEEKPILPAELVQTPASALKKLYRSIPDCVDAQDPAALYEALCKALSSCRSAPADTDPAHVYLIGLAYLLGIDVETDPEKALQLLTAAADAGYPDAFRKLVVMYRTGEGVSVNHRTALNWQEKLVETLKRQFSQHLFSNGNVLLDEIWNLGQYRMALKQLNEAEAAFHDMIQTAQSLQPHITASEFAGHTAGAYLSLGSIRSEQNDFEAAQDCYNKALSAIAAFSGNLPEAHWLRFQTSAINFYLGDIALKKCQYAEAQSYYRTALRIGAEASEAFPYESALSQCTGYIKLGDADLASGDIFSALDAFEHALCSVTPLKEETETPECCHHLISVYNRIGNVYKGNHELRKAEEYYTLGLRTAEESYRRTASLEAQRDLAVSYCKLSDLYSAMGNFQAASKYGTLYFDTTQSIYETAKTPLFKRDLAMAYERMAMQLKPQDIHAALDAFFKAMDLLAENLEARETAESLQDLTEVTVNVGNIHVELEEIEDGIGYYRIAYRLSERLISLYPSGTASNMLAVSAFSIGCAEADYGKIREAYEIWNDLCNRYPDVPEYRQRRDTAANILF